MPMGVLQTVHLLGLKPKPQVPLMPGSHEGKGIASLELMR